MPPKKGKGKANGQANGKVKKGKEPPPKIYNLICGTEITTKETAYINRLNELRLCLNVVDEAVNNEKKALDSEKIIAKWKRYLNCDEFPTPKSPPKIRLLFEKMRFFEDIAMKRTIDWQLSIDERSILSQDIDRIDKTRNTLIKLYRPQLGDLYNEDINKSFKVLKLIEYFIDDDPNVYKLKNSVLKDLIELEKDVQQKIYGFFDRYTYQIICDGSCYLDSVDGQTCEYFYKGTQFQLHIWALKNVAILFEFLPTECMTANFHLLNTKIQIPYSLLHEKMTIRGLHFDFDHFSPHAKTFVQKLSEDALKLNAGIPDLYKCLLNEWQMQVDLQEKVKNELLLARKVYEEKKLAAEGQSGSRKKMSDDGKSTSKKKKSPAVHLKEPQDIPENCIPDITEDFLALEQQEYIDFIYNNYHPHVLDLDDDEINLKKYFILGGVYQFYFVQQPTNFTFGNFDMTWHTNDGKLFIRHNLYVMNADTTMQLAGASLILTREPPGRKPPDEGGPLPDQEKKAESPYFKIVFKLPMFMCRWGADPIACHFEADVVGIVKAVVEDLKPAETAPVPAPVPATDEDQAMESFNTGAEETSTSKITERQSPLTEQAASTIFSSISYIFRSLMMNASDQLMGPFNNLIEDFDLDYPLTINQVYNIKRFCIPYILSSYKFPIETKDDHVDQEPVKQPHPSLTSRHAPKEEETIDRYNFVNRKQNNPERLFPIFKDVSPLRLNLPYFDPTLNDPQTFFELVKTFNYIHKLNSNAHAKIKNMPFYKQNLLWHKLKATKHERIEVPNTVSRTQKPRGGKLRMQKSVLKHPSSFFVANVAETDSSSVEEEEDEFEMYQNEGEDRLDTYKYSHWTKAHIVNQIFDREKQTITIYTDRLGTIGFAYNRYEHFPFTDWRIEPNPERPEEEILLTLDTQFVRVKLSITQDGFTGYVTDIFKGFQHNPMKYLTIAEPITDLKEFKKLFVESNLNIFSDQDACFYITNGYFSEKHLATELHTYSCMAINASLFIFMRSTWNRLATRRNIVLKLVELKNKDKPSELVELRITPEAATFVAITELCSDDLNVFNLNYTHTWRNIEFYADLHNAILSIDPTAMDCRIKNPKIICNVRNILSAIRPLSFS